MVGMAGRHGMRCEGSEGRKLSEMQRRGEKRRDWNERRGAGNDAGVQMSGHTASFLSTLLFFLFSFPFL